MDERRSRQTSDYSPDKDLREAPLVDLWFLESLLFGSPVSEKESTNDQSAHKTPPMPEHPEE